MNSEVILLTDSIISGPIGNSRYMGAYVLASQLQQKNIRTTVIDYFTRCENFFEYIEQFCSPELKCVAISTTFLSYFEGFQQNLLPERSFGINNYYNGELWFKTGEELKDWFSKLRAALNFKSPNCKIIIGGAKAQFAIWRNEYYKEVDYVCLGAGDSAIVEFVQRLKCGSPINSKVHNHVKILDNSFDLNNKSCPHTDWVSAFAVQRGESLPIEVSRGCLYNCKFCHYDKKQSVRKDLLTLKDELEKNYERFGVTTYHICDDCFNDHPKKVEEICGLFQKLSFSIEWTGYARVDVPVKFPDTMEAMISSGARGLCFGLESFNHKVALNAGKGTPPDKVKDFLINFKKKFSEDCLIEGSFIVGLPGETVESQNETADWLYENQPLDFLSIGSLGIMPFVTDFDKIVFDYAEYSRNPSKYGFKNINFSERFWEHETFNSTTASEMAIAIKKKWAQKKSNQTLQTMWLYTHLKTLGYNKKEIFSLARGSQTQFAFDCIQRFDSYLRNYFLDLANRYGQYDL